MGFVTSTGDSEGDENIHGIGEDDREKNVVGDTCIVQTSNRGENGSGK
jgi:hypothetical protein